MWSEIVDFFHRYSINIMLKWKQLPTSTTTNWPSSLLYTVAFGVHLWSKKFQGLGENTQSCKMSHKSIKSSNRIVHTSSRLGLLLCSWIEVCITSRGIFTFCLVTSVFVLYCSALCIFKLYVTFDINSVVLSCNSHMICFHVSLIT